ncbi:MAG: PSP1 domain-containing protein [Planctomycetota bacterium]|jgi:cell fate regulator YaaT (PSP1 superfamily)
MSDNGNMADTTERTDNGENKSYPTTAVRYGKMHNVGEFTYPTNLELPHGAKVVVTTDRGIELGEQIDLTCSGCPNGISVDQTHRYAEQSGEDTYKLDVGRILRVATEADLSEMRHIENEVHRKLEICRNFSEQLGLRISICDCEHILGGERIVFYFLAEERVDFRELVRKLAGEFQTRIEMRQIGARDEARLLADYETCGRECCCRHFLKTLKPISMSMAKLQKTTLDIAKVSGRCGRLKCCLRYEHENYQDLDANLPKMGARIATFAEVGRVIDRQIMTQLVKIRTDDERIVTVAVEDILQAGSPGEPLELGQEGPSQEEYRSLWAKPAFVESDEDLGEAALDEDGESDLPSVSIEYEEDDSEEVVGKMEAPAGETNGQTEVTEGTQQESDEGAGRGKRRRRSGSKRRRRRRKGKRN